jgi:hypothetical protein
MAASHVKARSETSEFWMGYDGAIGFVYGHPNERHQRTPATNS